MVIKFYFYVHYHSDFLRKKTTSLKGVHIVDNNTTLVDVFKQEAQKYIVKEVAGNHGGIQEPMDTGIAAEEDPFLMQSGDPDGYAGGKDNLNGLLCLPDILVINMYMSGLENEQSELL